MIEVGEYIRTDKGYITKILECLGKDIGYKNMQHYEVDCLIPYRGFIVYKEDIKAYSKNIIDLIEVGDYVNGTKVTNIDNYDGIYTIEWEYGNVYTTEIINDKFIETILTHEQYEQNCYKVGDIE